MIKPKGVYLILLVLCDIYVASALEDTTENGVISYDKDSVDLIVNIALSLFDSLQDYTKHINETEEKIKVKFKPKLIIEEVDTEPEIEHEELLFLEDESEFREISYDEEETSLESNEINNKAFDIAEDNLINHREDALKDSEARMIAIKLALEDTKDQGHIMSIINQGLINKEEGILPNQQENEIITKDETEDSKFKFHKEFPNIYSQSDSVFDILKEVGDDIKLTPQDMIKEQDRMRINLDGMNVEDNEIKSSERRTDEDNEEERNQDSKPETNSVNQDDNQEVKQKQRRRRKRRKRPFDGRENWEKLNRAIFGEETNELSVPTEDEENISKVQEHLENQPRTEEPNIGPKKKRRRKRRKGGKRKKGLTKASKLTKTIQNHPKEAILKMKPPAIHMSRPMPKIQIRGRPLNLQSFLNIF